MACENRKFYCLSGFSLSFCLSWKVAEQQLEGGGRKWKEKKKTGKYIWVKPVLGWREKNMALEAKVFI